MKFSIEGDSLPVVICQLDNGETMITESGAMSWMSANMNMETTSGGIGKMFGRALSGESLFLNRYTAMNGEGLIAFSSSFPGSIKPYQIAPGQALIVQKTAFLAGTEGIELSTYMQRKLSTGLVGGEGFIMQKITGNGVVFLEFDGYVKEYDLQPGQEMIIDTGYLAAMTESCSMEIRTVKGIKNKLLGGEGFFNTVVRGPGRIWIQSMPVYQVASVISPYIPTGK